MVVEEKEKPKVASNGGLSAVTIGGVMLPPRIFLYGDGGVGKSTLASKFDAPIFICTEDGASRINVPQFPQCRMWGDVFGCIDALGLEDHEYKTVVLDTADWAQSQAIKLVTDRDFDKSSKSFEAYGQGYGPLMAEWVKLLSRLDRLRQVKGMGIILLSHALKDKDRDPMTETFTSWRPNLVDTPKTSIVAKTKEWCDIMLYARFDINTHTDKDEKTKAVLHKNDAGGRVVYSTRGATWDAKVRAGWSLPDKFPLDYAIFRKHLQEGA